ncbi:hypothetical protein [Nonomuraea sp. NPDC049709]|uniref:hypothetical protein n=1 Tax=Nonomuraea sp. NPDC049709 TaxID=3154736 RepID=UPI00342B3CEE
MGAWVYVRGWLEFYGQRSQAERVIRDGGDPAGWTFPDGGWLEAACYARAVRASALDDLLDLVRRIAALPAADDDGDRVCGLFLAFHEGDGQSEWQVRDGEVVVGPAAPRHDYLWK